MKTLLPAFSTVQKICGEQPYKEGVSYRPTTLHVSVDSPDGTRLFHTLTGELLLLEKGEDWESCRRELIAHRFLAPEGFDERAYTNTIQTMMRMAKRSGSKTHFTVFSTMDCNARCFYCYEMGRKRTSMSEQTARDAAQYMLRVSNGDRIHLRWFGGEPLYNADAIRIICRELTQNDASFTSEMVSNGLLLTPETVREAKRDWHLQWVQITLDGTEQVYNRTKAFIGNPANPFLQVLDNIDACLQTGVRVSVRMNVNQKNADDILALCDLLHERFTGKEGFAAYAASIRDRAGQRDEFSEQTVAEAARKLKQYGIARAGRLSNTFLLNHCMADRDDSEIILPDGRLGKCEHYSENEFIGSIYESAQDQTVIRSFKERFGDVEPCKICPLYPRCIRLKKCEWESADCLEADRQAKIRSLEEQIRQYQPLPEE